MELKNIRLNKDFVINFAGQFWAALMGIIFIPLYISKLSLEGYAVIGVFSVILSFFSIIDFGLTPTATREMASVRSGKQSLNHYRNVLRTLEFLLLASFSTTLIILILFVPYMAENWLKPKNLSSEELIHGLYLMVFALVARWGEQFYRSILISLQDYRWVNIAWGLTTSLRWAGAALLLILFEPSLALFFLALLLSSLIGVLVFSRRVYSILPAGGKSSNFEWSAFSSIKKFASEMFFGSILIFILTNMDKLVVSKLLNLEEFGYYTLAVTISSCLLQIVAPINNITYPKFTHLLAKDDWHGASVLYIEASKLLSLLIIPPALIIVSFPVEVASIWTADYNTASSVSTILAILTSGMLLSCLMNMPYILQLAYGWVRLSTNINIFVVIALIPSLYITTIYFGVVGAASCWLVINLIYIFISVHLMHKKILPSIKWEWYKAAVVIPFSIGIIPLAILIYLNSILNDVLGVIPSLIFKCGVIYAFLFAWYKSEYLKRKLNVF